MLRHFFVSIADTRKSYIEAMVNVVSYYNEKLKGRVNIGILVRWTKWKNIPPLYRLHEKYGLKLFVDSAGFEQLSSNADIVNPMFPFKYASWYNRYSDTIDFIAVPDIPVHSRDKFFDSGTRLKLINETIRRAKIFTMISHEKEKIILVLQGFELEEYVYSFIQYMLEPVFSETRSMIHKNNDYYRVFAVGSVCVRKPEASGKTTKMAEGKAAGTLFQFMKQFLNHDWGDIRGFHFFGLHTAAIKRFGKHAMFYGSDTGAYGLNFKYKWKTTLKCRELNEECYAKAIEHQLRVSLNSFFNKQLD